MTDRILFVDDEPSILAAYQRGLRRQFNLETASNGEEALSKITNGSGYSVVISDMHMPGMNGSELLAKVKIASPDTIRIMLTGANDLSTAVTAVNQGSIFRFLTKPCPQDLLIRAIEDALRQYHLVTAERNLLNKTLAGAVGVLTDILSLVEPRAFGKAEAIRSDIRAMGAALGVEDLWELEMGAMLSHIGHVTVPPVVLLKSQAGRPLTSIEQDMLQRVPETGSMLLANIPRLEQVARIVLYVNKHFSGGGFPPDSVKGTDIPLGARIIRLLTDLAVLEGTGLSRADGLAVLRSQPGIHDPSLIDLCGSLSTADTSTPRITAPIIRDLTPGQLRAGHIIRCDLRSADGQLLIANGQAVSAPMIERLANLARLTQLPATLRVEIPILPSQIEAIP